MRTAGKIATGLAAAIVGGATWLYARELATEKPKSETIEEDGRFSIRRYPRLTMAETIRPGARKVALNSGFGMLADYIFAESREGEAIAMTAPVLAEPAGRDWRVRFVMPAEWSRGTLPAPTPGVAIEEVPERTVAVARFAGRADDAMLAREEAALRAWLKAAGRPAAATAEHAFYNSPMIPGPLRRNEILIQLDDNQIG